MRTERGADGAEYTYDDDGRCVRVHVPTLLMDSGPAQLPPHEQRIVDNQARLTTLGHLGASYGMRPGMVSQPAGTMAAADSAYHEMVEATSSAWRTPAQPAPTADAEPPRPQQPQSMRAADADRAYEERNERLRNAWRSAA